MSSVRSYASHSSGGSSSSHPAYRPTGGADPYADGDPYAEREERPHEGRRRHQTHGSGSRGHHHRRHSSHHTHGGAGGADANLAERLGEDGSSSSSSSSSAKRRLSGQDGLPLEINKENLGGRAPPPPRSPPKGPVEKALLSISKGLGDAARSLLPGTPNQTGVGAQHMSGIASVFGTPTPGGGEARESRHADHSQQPQVLLSGGFGSHALSSPRVARQAKW